MSNIFEDAVDATLNGWTINGTSLKGITVPPHLIIWFKMTRPSLACIALQNKLLSPARGYHIHTSLCRAFPLAKKTSKIGLFL